MTTNLYIWLLCCLIIDPVALFHSLEWREQCRSGKGSRHMPCWCGKDSIKYALLIMMLLFVTDKNLVDDILKTDVIPQEVIYKTNNKHKSIRTRVWFQLGYIIIFMNSHVDYINKSFVHVSLQLLLFIWTSLINVSSRVYMFNPA